jgi:protein transport protein HofQ
MRRRTEMIVSSKKSICWLALIVVAFGLILLPPCLRAERTPNVTLNLQNVDIHQFLRLAQALTGVNVIVAPDVHGRITAFVHDVPWELALDEVLKTNGLVGVREGNILRVLTIGGARREQHQYETLQQLNEASAPVQICTYHLNNADARETANVLRSFLSPRGRIAADSRTNTLIIRDRPEVLESLGIASAQGSRTKCWEIGQRGKVGRNTKAANPPESAATGRSKFLKRVP